MLKKKERNKARFHAIQALYQKELANSTTSDLKLQFYNENMNRHKVDWKFFDILVEGVINNKLKIDSKIKIYTIDNIDLITIIDFCILRLGSFEILFLEIPYQVVIYEYVEQAKLLGATNSYKLVNSILEKIYKENF